MGHPDWLRHSLRARCSADHIGINAMKIQTAFNQAHIQHALGAHTTKERDMRMYVYINEKLIVVETNLAWALPYWKQRKALHKHITWSVK